MRVKTYDQHVFKGTPIRKKCLPATEDVNTTLLTAPFALATLPSTFRVPRTATSIMFF